MTTIPLHPQEKPRLHGLDYLRGLAAVGIMTYHYSSWAFGAQEASSFLGRLGIYGVAVFYVLSGQALTYIYAPKLTLRLTSLREFYNKRVFRIFPLLWLATLLSIFLSKRFPNLLDLSLNLTGLFGLFKWDTYFATGAWSIGNEVTFYLVFPLLIFLLNKHPIGLLSVVALSGIIFIYFAFYKIKVAEPLVNQWHLYTNPANQFAFFLGGALMGRLINPASMKTGLSFLMGAIGMVLFLFTPIGKNTVELVTGFNRLVFAVSCFLLCCSFFRTDRAVNALDRPLAMLGQASYSLYLLHPIVWAVVKACFALLAKQGLNYSNLPMVVVAGIISLSVSYLSYQHFERFFIKLSHKRNEVAGVR